MKRWKQEIKLCHFCFSWYFLPDGDDRDHGFPHIFHLYISLLSAWCSWADQKKTPVIWPVSCQWRATAALKSQCRHQRTSSMSDQLNSKFPVFQCESMTSKQWNVNVISCCVSSCVSISVVVHTYLLMCFVIHTVGNTCSGLLSNNIKMSNEIIYITPMRLELLLFIFHLTSLRLQILNDFAPSRR